MALTGNADFITLLMSRLGRKTNTAVRALIVDEINVQIDELEAGSFLPWFLEASSSVGISQGISTSALPAGFIREVEGSRPKVVKDADGTESVPRKRRAEQLEQLGLNVDDQGTPTRYAISGSSLLTWPAADGSYTFYIPSMIKTTDVTDSNAALNLWIQHAPNYILGLVGAVMAQFHIGDPVRVKAFLETSTRARVELIASNEARQSTNMNYSSSDALVEEDSD